MNLHVMLDAKLVDNHGQIWNVTKVFPKMGYYEAKLIKPNRELGITFNNLYVFNGETNVPIIFEQYQSSFKHLLAIVDYASDYLLCDMLNSYKKGDILYSIRHEVIEYLGERHNKKYGTRILIRINDKNVLDSHTLIGGLDSNSFRLATEAEIESVSVKISNEKDVAISLCNKFAKKPESNQFENALDMLIFEGKYSLVIEFFKLISDNLDYKDDYYATKLKIDTINAILNWENPNTYVYDNWRLFK